MLRIEITVIVQNILDIFDAEPLIRNGGLLIVFLIVYGSTGLFFCFFMPSGGVLFATGIFVATGGFHYSIFFVCGLLIVASVPGNITGYWFGRKTGPLLYSRKDSTVFRKHYLRTAEAFYIKYGWLTLTAGLFIPIIRTFASIVAGIIRLDFYRFVLFIFIGSMIWIVSFVSAGDFIASQPYLKPWLKYIVLAFIIIVTLPLIFKIFRELKKLRKETSGKV